MLDPTHLHFLKLSVNEKKIFFKTAKDDLVFIKLRLFS